MHLKNKIKRYSSRVVTPIILANKKKLKERRTNMFKAIKRLHFLCVDSHLMTFYYLLYSTHIKYGSHFTTFFPSIIFTFAICDNHYSSVHTKIIADLTRVCMCVGKTPHKYTALMSKTAKIHHL